MADTGYDWIVKSSLLTMVKLIGKSYDLTNGLLLMH